MSDDNDRELTIWIVVGALVGVALVFTGFFVAALVKGTNPVWAVADIVIVIAALSQAGNLYAKSRVEKD